ncbi:MAG: hypothetical protein HC903_05320 [Methylacidiphilales bacterium]|nr:hypothetical protein [Candidatus Methylacidiphilales bacterium]NJR14832.1 hypothetical protein [Calothrix sp. CSU_2_0]
MVWELKECDEESLSGGKSSTSGDITLTATSNNTYAAIALPSLIGQVNKAKQ